MNPDYNHPKRGHNFIDDIKNIQKEIYLLKTPQKIGVDSIVTHRTRSDDENDYNISVTGSHTLEVTFVHASGKRAIVDVGAYHRIGNPDVMGNPIPHAATTSDVLISVARVPEETEGETKFLIGLWNNVLGGAPQDTYIKLFFMGTSSGTFSISTI